MKPITIICPKCQNQISIDEALSHQLEEEFKNKLTLQTAAELESEKEKLRKKMELWQEDQAKKMQKTAEEAGEKLAQRAQEENRLLKEENERKDKLLHEARELELKMRLERNKLEDDKKSFELQKQRQLDEERAKIREEAVKQELEKHRLTEAEKDKQLQDMKKQIEDLQLKANQGSQQRQGEVLELELEKLLGQEFPIDEITPVGKGINGADILQKVRDGNGRICGIIVWESKRTKSWSDGWVAKLKEDTLQAKGDMSVLVTMSLPDGIKSFGFKDGIFITSFEHFLGIAVILRKTLLDHQLVKMSVVGKNEKMEMLYNYISSNEFIQKVELMLEACTTMRTTLNKEKMMAEKLWAQREKEIDKIVSSTVTIHGSLTGLIGASIPEIRGLGMDNILSSEDQIVDQSLLFEQVALKDN